ncbi:hypothetical protein B9Z55_007643 [Caenorhabditis nigoni]|uniref:Retrotransposon gag domain-containing protein n=1 Tax=Caenorhabditis nigoni TaxID=1611254 RepID=A0A2G5VAI1_9PELO|nr:hypothetical protein B9Z55_007643 [Caenorhabditis nigoni]
MSQVDSGDDEQHRKETEGRPEDQHSIDSATWMDVDELKLLEERHVRLAKNSEIEAKFRAEIKQKTSLGEHNITKLVNIAFNLIVEKEELIDNREDVIAKYIKWVDTLQKEAEKSQNDAENLQIPSTSSPPPPMVAADGNHEGQGASMDMVRFLQENEIDSVEELQQKLTELNKLKREMKLHQNFQLKRERIATASSSKSHEEPKLDSRVVESLRSMIRDLELDKKLLEEENRSLKTSSSGKKMLGRIEGGNLSQSKENEEFQRQDVSRTGMTGSGGRKPMEGSMPGEHFGERERARESVHNETMNGCSPEYGGEEQKFFAKPHYQSSWDMGRPSEMAMFAMMQQMRTEDRLPEPPKYTSEEKSTSLDVFIRIFKLKYGRLSDEQQVILLEANFLGGKALKVFRSIPEYEKESFETVIAAMSDRLRVSEADESHRAKTRWEQLRRRENETVEDYCLALDELAKRAFVGISPRQIASIKIAKLLSAIASNEYMASAVQDKIDDLPQVEQ